MRRRTDASIARRAAAALLAVAAVAGVACGRNAVEPTSTQAVAGAAEGAHTEHGHEHERTVRFALPAEPLWQWMNDSGAVADWEDRHNLRLETVHPYEPFTALISGHADVVVVDALDVPALSLGLSYNPVVIGMYSHDRSIAATKRTSQAADMAGVVEGRVVLESEMGSMLMWSLIVDEAHALDLSGDSRDFDLVVASFGLAALVENGNADVCICLPEMSVPEMSSGMLRPLYDGRSAAQVYADLHGPRHVPPGKVFLTTQDWFDAHLHEVLDFLDIWERAVQHWHSHSAELIAQYPHLLSVRTDAEIAWLTDYVRRNDWIAPSVYLSEADEAAYLEAVAGLQARGLLPADAAMPVMVTAQDLKLEDH
ncbi:hypothetical protein [Candidatus Poriferisodalis sp.]|uniref:hypothetical protein n=1 Tax=Candidatus Poriferisodalis sp. TaxID=3101277 RepID=UPI003B014479